jgi:hypothetical protein
MSTYRLDKLFAPRSVAVVGASPRDTSPGRAVLSNLRAAAFEGSIDLVNPRYAEIEGIKAVKTIQDLPTLPSGFYWHVNSSAQQIQLYVGGYLPFGSGIWQNGNAVRIQ